MKVRDIIELLEHDRWYLKATKGSHRQYKQPTKSGRVTPAGSSRRRSGTGWSAYVPDLPGVVTTGATREKAKKLIREAIEFHLDGLREDNFPIPEPAASAEVVTVS